MKFQLYRSGQLWYWRLRAANNEIIAQGEGYVNRQDAVNVVNLVMDTTRQTPFVEVNA
jgi:uncharacterized protein YegP (UPF0339 family)